jgi:hypothetical protein
MGYHYRLLPQVLHSGSHHCQVAAHKLASAADDAEIHAVLVVGNCDLAKEFLDPATPQPHDQLNEPKQHCPAMETANHYSIL